MRFLWLAVISFWPTYPLCHAQTTNGFAFLAAGRQVNGGLKTPVYGIGGGFDHQYVGPIGAGLDLEGIIPGRGKAADSVGALSGNLYFHIRGLLDRIPRAADLFATGGYGLAFRDFAANGYNLGTGWNFWSGEHTALRIEYRYQRAHQKLPGNANDEWTHWWAIRVGITFGSPYWR